jgi:polysaccharide export outer membrane protein
MDGCQWFARALRAVSVVVLLCTGCQATSCLGKRPADPDVPRELTKATIPEYVIEPPDILLIDAVRVVPLPPYRIQPLDALAVMVTEALPQQPIQGIYAVDPDGTINLGFSYGSVRVVDLTVEEARTAIDTYLRQIIKPGYQVNVALAEARARQQIAGPHLVRPDGRVGLGTYGSVPVVGLTLEQAKAVIEQHLSQFLLRPEVALDVYGYNSKVYYVIADGAGSGETVVRLPVTGNETVLDALSQIYGLPPVASKKRIWVARPVPAQAGCDLILPVDWQAITQRGETDTNYQIMPGDRVYVHSQPLLTLDSTLAKILAPVERVFGAILLGSTTVQTLQGKNLTGTGG